MAVFVLPKWAKLNDITRHLKLYQEIFIARTHLPIRKPVNDPTQHEVVAPPLLQVYLCLVDDEFAFYDSAPTISSVEDPSLYEPPYHPTSSIATLR
jgi:hypothetical protein